MKGRRTEKRRTLRTEGAPGSGVEFVLRKNLGSRGRGSVNWTG